MIYFHRRDGTGEKIFLIVIGILLLVGIVGLIFLIVGILAKPEVWVVTNHRYMHIVKGKPAEFVVAADITGVVRKVAGSIPKWLILTDAFGRTVSLQMKCNPPAFDQMMMRYLKDPRLLEQQPPVPYEA